ncbi:hypothetical protein CR513_48891, partial [Mucuna pruriens]
MLNGTNFKVWKEVVKPILTPDNLQEVKIKKWKRSNRMWLMIIKRLTLEAFQGFIFESQR